MKAHTKKRNEGTQARRTREHVRHVRHVGTYDMKAREAQSLAHSLGNRVFGQILLTLLIFTLSLRT